MKYVIKIGKHKLINGFYIRVYNKICSSLTPLKSEAQKFDTKAEAERIASLLHIQNPRTTLVVVEE